MDLSTNSREPYPGLRSFRKDESDIFFGRDEYLDEMVAKLAEHHFLCITGPSGCGKSSLARTGLMNHLEAGFLRGCGSDWLFCDMRPGDRPLAALFDAVAATIAAEIKLKGGESGEDCRKQIQDLISYPIETQRRTSDLNRVVDAIGIIGERPMMILIDQFEELFRYASADSDKAISFVEILLRTAAAKGNIYVVVTIRTDELEKCSRYPNLTQMINESQFLTPALDRYQIQEAIEGPIALWGGRTSSAFCTWFLNCLEDELDKLPLMQHALKILYREKCTAEGRQDVTIDVADFVRVFRLPPSLNLSSPEGRLALRSSLSDRLTQRYNELPDQLKPAAQRMFCALTAVESQGRDIRQPLNLAALSRIIGVSVEDTRTIVRAFSVGDEAYLRSDPRLAEDDTVDVTHECILRLWLPLQTHWLSDERKSADNIVLLAGLARDWDSSSKERSALIRFFWPAVLKGYTRQLYQKWFEATRPNPDWAARYLNRINWPASHGPRKKLSPEEIFTRITALLDASKAHRTRVVIASIAGTVLIVAVVALLYGEVVATRLQQDQLQLSVGIQNESIEGLMKTVHSASLSSSLPAQERRAITDSATRSVEKLADQVKGYPEYKVMLIPLFNNLSDLAYDAEDWEKAEKTAQTAQSLAQPLVTKSPDDPDLQRLFYRSTWLLADALSEEKRTADRAEQEYQHALNIATDLVRLTNGDLRSNREVAFIEPKLGDMCLERKDIQCALAHYRNALAINQRLLAGPAKDDAVKPDIQRDLAANKIRIGDVFSKQKVMLNDALKQYESAAETDEELVAAHPDELIYQSNLSRVYSQIANLREQQGDLPAVMKWYQKSLKLRRNVARRDPSNNRLLVYLAMQYGQIGDVLVKMGDSPDRVAAGGAGTHTADAITNYKSAENVWDILVSRIPKNSNWMRQSSEVIQKHIKLLHYQSAALCHSRERDIKVCSDAEVSLRNVATNSWDSALQHRELADAYVSLGDVFKAIGDNAESIKQYQEALSIIDNFTSAPPNGSGLQALNELRQDLCNRHSDVCR